MEDTKSRAAGAENMNSASLDIRFGRATARLDVRISTGGLLAVGALVTGILLAVAPIVWTATRGPRRSRLTRLPRL